LVRRAKAVGIEDPGGWQAETHASQFRLRNWAAQAPKPNWAMLTYRSYPLLRYFLIDDRVVFASHYVPDHDIDSKEPKRHCPQPAMYRIEREKSECECLFDFYRHAHTLLGEYKDVTQPAGRGL